jgi:hypothetical protein
MRSAMAKPDLSLQAGVQDIGTGTFCISLNQGGLLICFLELERADSTERLRIHCCLCTAEWKLLETRTIKTFVTRNRCQTPNGKNNAIGAKLLIFNDYFVAKRLAEGW